VVAGYTLSNDSAIGEVKCDYRTLWDVTTDKLQNLKAEILTSNESKGLIKAKVSDNDVTVKIDTLSQSVQKLKISARKYLLPKPQFAQKIFVKIVQDLE
jgi:predicted AlkP superfamily phosphohydrolase/phosphomutase